jgi:hypothetical protein
MTTPHHYPLPPFKLQTPAQFTKKEKKYTSPVRKSKAAPVKARRGASPNAD